MSRPDATVRTWGKARWAEVNRRTLEAVRYGLLMRVEQRTVNLKHVNGYDDRHDVLVGSVIDPFVEKTDFSFVIHRVTVGGDLQARVVDRLAASVESTARRVAAQRVACEAERWLYEPLRDALHDGVTPPLAWVLRVAPDGGDPIAAAWRMIRHAPGWMIDLCESYTETACARTRFLESDPKCTGLCARRTRFADGTEVYVPVLPRDPGALCDAIRAAAARCGFAPTIAVCRGGLLTF